MRYNVYSLRDKVSNQFRDLTLNLSDDVAKRDLGYAVNNNPQLQYMSKDLELYHVGEFDGDKGIMIPVSPIRMVIQCDQLIGVKE